MAESTKSSSKTEKKDKNENFSEATAEVFKSFTEKMPQIDREQILENHRKNLETLGEAQKMAVELLKTVAQLQSQFLRQTFDEMNESLRDVMRNPTSKDRFQTHADKMKETMEKAVDHTSNLANVILKSNLDVYKLVQDRFKQGLESFDKKPH